MGIMNTLRDREFAKVMLKYEAENRRESLEVNSQKRKPKDFLIKTIGFINSYAIGRELLAQPEYDFEEIKRAAETDSYIKTSLNKYQRMVYKAGYYIKSENDKCVRYLNKRFRIMSYATGKPMEILFQEIANDMITYSNCVLIKTRVKEIMPGVKAQGLFGDDPIGGYSRIDPSTVSIQRDECGNVLSYTQTTVNGKSKKYKPKDVIHFYMDKESSNAFGTPKIIAALEDVKLLRKLEGNVLAIIHRFAVPIFHWKIGKPQQGFQATDMEIEDARREIEGMSLDGVVITNEKTEINVLGAEGSAINASEYLAYFEARVFSALDTSASQMGRGGAKQDSDSMEGQSHDYIKHVQRTLSVFIENYILSELLIEGGFNPILNEEDCAQYVFNEISLDTKVKIENHEMLKYQSNMQTLKETRRNIGYREDVSLDELYKNMIETEAQIKIASGVSKAQADQTIRIEKEKNKIASSVSSTSTSDTKSTSSSDSSALGNLTNGKTASQNPNNDVQNRNTPTNQHGTTSVNIKESLDITEGVIRSKTAHKKKYKDFYSKIDKFKNSVTQSNADIDYLISITVESLSQDMKSLINSAAVEGKQKALKDLTTMKIDTTMLAATDLNLEPLYKQSLATINDVFTDIKTRLGDDREFSHVDTVISALDYRLRFAIEYILPKTVWYTYLKSGEVVGIKEAKVNFGDSTDSEKYPDIIDVRNFRLDQIPAYHPFCDCSLKFKKES